MILVSAPRESFNLHAMSGILRLPLFADPPPILEFELVLSKPITAHIMVLDDPESCHAPVEVGKETALVFCQVPAVVDSNAI